MLPCRLSSSDRCPVDSGKETDAQWRLCFVEVRLGPALSLIAAMFISLWTWSSANSVAAANAARSFTPLVPLKSPRVTDCAEEYPGGSYVVEHLVDGREQSEYASNGRGTETFVEFDFGRPVRVRGLRHVDRQDVATVAESQLVFSNTSDFSDVIARETIAHADTPGGRTVELFSASHVARYVRWQPTRLNAGGHRCLGGRDVRFFTSKPPEPTLERNRIDAQAPQAVWRGEQSGRRPVRIDIEHVYAEPVEVLVEVGDLPAKRRRLTFGKQTVQVAIPASEEKQTVPIVVKRDGNTDLHKGVTVTPVRHWELHFLPHSHVDIGYTHVQTEVERKQWRYLEEAMEIARRTADYPPASRFKWNAEVLWAVDSYLEQATNAEKAEFIDAVRRGVIHLDGLYGNELTALCRPEELIRLTECARRISNRYDVPIDAAMISDVPGYTWGLVPALVDSGIKYLSMGPNHIHRIGLTLEQWGDRPFYWRSPAGDEKLLCWMAGKAYSWFHGSRVGTLSRDSKHDPFFAYLDELLEKDYPYELVQIRYSIGGDNGPPDQALSEFVRGWNEKYRWPRMVISTTSSLMHTLEDRHGEQIPEVSGDFTPYWEDGAASSARETALARNAAERLVQAEALWAMRNPADYPVDSFYSAWRNVLLYNEHTWGAHCSISKPDSEFTRSQWKIKQRFALDARRQSRELLDQALPVAENSEGPVNTVDVWNTTSWPRTDLARVDTHRPLAGYVVKDRKGQVVPAQRLASSSGQLVFLAQNVPPFGAKRYLLEPGKPQPVGQARAEGTVLRTSSLSLKVDPDTGAVAGLRMNGVPEDLVDGGKNVPGLNCYQYVTGRDPTAAEGTRKTQVKVLEQGGLVASLAVEQHAPGVRQLTTILRVVEGLHRVDIVNVLDKKRVLDKEAVHIGFPFHVPSGVMRVNTPWAVVEPEADQLPGACKNYLTVGRWVDVSNDDFGITWATRDAPLIEVGGIHVDVPQPLSSDGWIKHLEPSQTLYSYLMNNYWETNYRAAQQGKTVFRYSLNPHQEFDPAAAARFATARCQPLLVRPADRKSPVRQSMLSVSGPGVVVTSVKPSADGKALMVRLFNTGDAPAEAGLNCPGFTPQRMTLSSPREKTGEPLDGPIDMPSLGIVTVRIDLDTTD